MNAIDLIKDDHREVERLYSEFLASEDSEPSQREEIFQQLEKELLVHGDVEERIFYPAIERLASKKIEQSRQEHSEIRQILADMLPLEVEDEAFDEKLTTLMETVRTHVQEEEAPDGVLELARLKLDAGRLDLLARQMLELKRSSSEELAA
jgi:hemerythrin superfamily protein